MKSLEEKIIKIVATELRIREEEVHLDSHLINDLGVDSLDTVELLVAMEQEFNIEFDETLHKNIVTVKDIVDDVNSYLKK